MSWLNPLKGVASSIKRPKSRRVNALQKLFELKRKIARGFDRTFALNANSKTPHNQIRPKKNENSKSAKIVYLQSTDARPARRTKGAPKPPQTNAAGEFGVEAVKLKVAANPELAVITEPLVASATDRFRKSRLEQTRADPIAKTRNGCIVIRITRYQVT